LGKVSSCWVYKKIELNSSESGRLLVVNKTVKFSSFKMKSQGGVSEFEILQNEVIRDFSIFDGREILNILVLTSTGKVYGKKFKLFKIEKHLDLKLEIIQKRILTFLKNILLI
jgi:hypothetical protein